MAFCSICGRQIPDGEKYCDEHKASPGNSKDSFGSSSDASGYPYTSELLNLNQLLEHGIISKDVYEDKCRDILLGTYGHKSDQEAPLPKIYAKKPLIAGLLALLIGFLGIHKFYLGYKKQGFIMLILSILVIGFVPMCIIALIEAISYWLTDDEEFQKVYVEGRKPWF